MNDIYWFFLHCHHIFVLICWCIFLNFIYWMIDRFSIIKFNVTSGGGDGALISTGLWDFRILQRTWLLKLIIFNIIELHGHDNFQLHYKSLNESSQNGNPWKYLVIHCLLDLEAALEFLHLFKPSSTASNVILHPICWILHLVLLGSGYPSWIELSNLDGNHVNVFLNFVIYAVFWMF